MRHECLAGRTSHWPELTARYQVPVNSRRSLIFGLAHLQTSTSKALNARSGEGVRVVDHRDLACGPVHGDKFLQLRESIRLQAKYYLDVCGLRLRHHLLRVTQLPGSVNLGSVGRPFRRICVT